MAKTKKTTKRTLGPRRGLEQRIAELDAKLVALRQRIAAKRNPALKHVLEAQRALDRAIEACEEVAHRRKLTMAQEILEGFSAGGSAFDEDGVVPAAPRRGRRAGGAIDEETLLAHVRAHPGQRGEQISQALGLDTKALRPVMKRLIAAGKVRTEGQRRGMTYSAD